MGKVMSTLCSELRTDFPLESRMTNMIISLYITGQNVFIITRGCFSADPFIHSINIYGMSASARHCSKHMWFSNDQIPACVALNVLVQWLSNFAAYYNYPGHLKITRSCPMPIKSGYLGWMQVLVFKTSQVFPMFI